MIYMLEKRDSEYRRSQREGRNRISVILGQTRIFLLSDNRSRFSFKFILIFII